MRGTIAKNIRQLYQMQGEPLYLARGVSIGVFVAIAPLMPLKTVTIIALSALMGGSMIAAMVSCTIICNPLTYLPLYYCSWYIGDVLVPGKASWSLLELHLEKLTHSSLDQALLMSAQIGLDIILVVFTGGMVLAVPLGLASYPFARQFFLKMRKPS